MLKLLLLWRAWQEVLDSPCKGLPWSLLALQVAKEPLYLFLSFKLPPGLKPALAEDDRTSASDAYLIQSNTNKTEVGFGLFFCKLNRWQVAQERRDTSKATHSKLLLQ